MGKQYNKLIKRRRRVEYNRRRADVARIKTKKSRAAKPAARPVAAE
jgi:hypothetical protein